MADKWSPTSQKLRDALNKPSHPYTRNTKNWGPIPDVPHAPPFRREPLVIGQPETARLVDRIIQYAPELRGGTKRILAGPNEDVLDYLLGRGSKRPYNYSPNLYGMQNMLTDDISINPMLQDMVTNKDLSQTIIHELAHSKGYTDNRDTDDPYSAYSVMRNVPEELYQDRGKSAFDHYNAGLSRWQNPWPRGH